MFGRRSVPNPAVRPDRTGLIVFGCLGLFVIAAVVTTLLVVLVVVGARRETGGGGRAKSHGPRIQPWAACQGTPSPERSFEEALAVADPRQVDVADVLGQTRSLARRLEPDAALTSIESAGLAVEGKYDLTTGSLSTHFEYRCLDATKPPGQDKRSGQVFVFVRDGRVRAERLPGAAVLLEIYPPLEDRPCRTADAWRAVVVSGVPKEAQASFLYSQPVVTADDGSVWMVAIPGHPEYQRNVDARTCNRLTQGNTLFPIVLPPAPAPSVDPVQPPATPPATVAVPAATTAEPPAAPADEPRPSSTASGSPTPSATTTGRAPGAGASSAPGPNEAPANGGCTLNVNSIPASQVLLDGRPIGTTPKMALPTPCGPHAVTFVHPERGRKTTSVSLVPGKVATVAVRF